MVRKQKVDGTHIIARAQKALRSLYSHKCELEGLIARYERGERGSNLRRLVDEVEQMEEAFQIEGGE